MAKLQNMSRFVPGFFKPTLNPNVRGLLYAWSSEDDRIVQAAQDAKEQLFVKYAQLQYLDALGSNVGVFRPSTFGLGDAQYRQLIPALSYYPKQVVPTISKVLEVFYGENNPRVFIKEVNPNEIVIQIPSSVPALRRSVKGSLHFHNYSGVITAIDNIGKTMTVNLDGDTKNLKVDELSSAKIGQDSYSEIILSNTAGSTGVVFQFSIGANLSVFSLGRYNIANVKNYPGSFLPDPRRSFTATLQRGKLGQSITAGNIHPTLLMTDASNIPDSPGRIIFNLGRGNEEADVKYFGRPNNTTLLIDPSYNFSRDHSIGEMVNVIVKPYRNPNVDGTDYSTYLVGVTAARILAQQIVKSIVAAGVVIRWIVVEPVC